ncbi:MAG TPA: L-threonylcarbamoyladenylate synthase [Tepidisphaeraceae bacterium]|nr:L-threonylcarbamoyladenylate synthase [Tepidisphaeraceae bacterium]
MDLIEQATTILRRGGLVAFPTETVYGLGADATNNDAVARIFKAKGRPPTNPLIVHVATVAVARRYATTWPAIAEQLASRFWPGPLTLVLPKAKSIAPAATAGRDSVGLRMPNHPLALAMLAGFDGPVAAPSANRSNHISPTQASHVRQELGDDVDLILDGGPCDIGIESTVLDLTQTRPRILRPGGVSRAQIESIAGPVEMFEGTTNAAVAAASPGQHERHYSPRTPAYRLSAPGGIPASGATLVIGLRYYVQRPIRIEMPNDPIEYAKHLYTALREMDDWQVERIYVQMPPADPAWTAVRDRLMRATRAT